MAFSESPSQPQNVLETIWHNCSMTDLVICCCDGQVKAHRAIVAIASPVLKEAMIEAYEDILEETAVYLPDFGVYEVEALLSLVYLGYCFISAQAQRSVLHAAAVLGVNLAWWPVSDECPSLDDCPTPTTSCNWHQVPDTIFTPPVNHLAHEVHQTNIDFHSVAVEESPAVLENAFVGETLSKHPSTIVEENAVNRLPNAKTFAVPKSPARKGFSCDVCGKSFKKSAMLERHSRTHTGEKPFKCDVCGKSFSRSHHLVDHKKIHAPEKQHSCPYCGLKFVRRSVLVHHFRAKHANAREFACGTCGRRFARKDALKRHEAAKHEKPADGTCSNSDQKPFLDIDDEERRKMFLGSPTGSDDDDSIFGDIPVSSVMTSYDNIEPDFVL